MKEQGYASNNIVGHHYDRLKYTRDNTTMSASRQYLLTSLPQPPTPIAGYNSLNNSSPSKCPLFGHRQEIGMSVGSERSLSLTSVFSSSEEEQNFSDNFGHTEVGRQDEDGVGGYHRNRDNHHRHHLYHVELKEPGHHKIYRNL